VLINMVASLDGKATVGGKAGSIGSSTDRLLMRALRAHADAVMTGAGTLRAEKLTLAVPENLALARASRGLKPQPLAVLVTATGDLPLEANLLGPSPDDLLILTSPETPKARLAALSARASVELVPKETANSPGEFASSMAGSGLRLDMARGLEILKKRYAVEVLLVEGGPVLNHALVSLGLADELFLTLAPKLLGGERPDARTILEGPALSTRKTPKVELVSTHLFGDELFLRYALRPPDLAQLPGAEELASPAELTAASRGVVGRAAE
jgi:riboflavin-specific deaminase-like protein